MDIKEIYIKNFRNIGEEGATIKLSPVTIFTGCNSAGKSTAAKALLLLDAYLSDVKSSNFNLIDTPLDFSKVGKLGSFDHVLNKAAKENGHNEISFGYSFASVILVADVKVFLTFGKRDTNELNNGWLKELSIFIDSTELLNIRIKDGIYSLDIKDKNKFVEYIRCYRVRHIVSLWKEQEEIRRASQDYPEIDSHSKPQKEILNPKLSKLLDLERKLVKDGILRPIIWGNETDGAFINSINSYDIVSAIENIIDLNTIDKIIYDVEKSKGSRLNSGDIKMISNKIEEHYIGEIKGNLDEDVNRWFNGEKGKDEEYVLSYINSEFPSFSEFKRHQPVLNDFINIFNDTEYQDFIKGTATPGILEIREYSSLTKSVVLPFRYILNRALTPSFYGRVGYVDASTVEVRRLYPLDFSDSFGNLWKRFDKMKVTHKHSAKIEPGTFMRTWLQKFDICDYIMVENLEGSLHIKLITEEVPEGRSLADYGYGVTQLVALLLNIEIAINNVGYEYISIMGMPGDCDGAVEVIPYLLILEEPEVHLHPNLQSRLADMFLDACRHGVRFVIETHSEYLVRRTQVLVSDMKLNEDNIDSRNKFRVYYFPANGVPYDMKYMPSGRFECSFGEGFFDESARWHMEILKKEKTHKQW